MKLFNLLAGASAVLMIGSAAPLAWGQATAEPSAPGASTAIAPSAASPTVPGEKAAPGAPGSGVSMDNPSARGSEMNNPNAAAAPGTSGTETVKSAYVHKKIDEAQAQGKDVSAAQIQEHMGDAALKKGMNDEAAQHFETALRSIGVMPNAPDENPGEATSPHRAMSGAVD